MEARGEVLKWAALSGALDDLPLDALKLYLLLFARVEDIGYVAFRACGFL